MNSPPARNSKVKRVRISEPTRIRNKFITLRSPHFPPLPRLPFQVQCGKAKVVPLSHRLDEKEPVYDTRLAHEENESLSKED